MADNDNAIDNDFEIFQVLIAPGLYIEIEGSVTVSHHTHHKESLAVRADRDSAVSLVHCYGDEEDEDIHHRDAVILFCKSKNIDKAIDRSNPIIALLDSLKAVYGDE